MKKIILFLIYIAISNFSYSQSVPLNASEALKFDADLSATSSAVGINTDNFTGTSQVNIPIYSYSLAGVDLGVTIGYVTNGIQVDRVPSSVGLGWEVNFGGSIHRTVRGSEDDVNVISHSIVDHFIASGYWFEGGNDWLDEEPDVFQVNIGSVSFSFMFSHTGDLLTIPDNSGMKVDRIIDDNPVSGVISNESNHFGNLKFIITDQKGNKFYFTPTFNVTVHHKTKFYGIESDWTYTSPTSWNLEKVLTYEGEVITYYYDRADLGGYLGRSQQFQEKNNNYGVILGKEEPDDFSTYRITKISYPSNVDVLFNYDIHDRVDVVGDKRLESIKITERNTSLGVSPNSYSFKLSHSYFLSPDSNTIINPSHYLANPSESESDGTAIIPNTRYRLRLNSISKIGTDGSTIMSYLKFQYNPVPLSQRFFGCRDIYGYNNVNVPQLYTNSFATRNLLVPIHSVVGAWAPTLGVPDDPSDDVNVTGACVLTSVENDKGAVTTLAYTTTHNVCSPKLNSGGLVTNSIHYFDGYNHENDYDINYSYENCADMVAQKEFKYHISTHTYYEPDNHQEWLMHNISATLANIPLNGSPYGFKKVTEETLNASGDQIGKTISTFMGIESEDADGIISSTTGNYYAPDFSSSDPDFNRAFSEPPFTSKQLLKKWAIGLPLTISKYDQQNNILNETKYYYDVSTHYETSNFKGKHKLGHEHVAGDLDVTYGFPETYYNDVYYPFSGHCFLIKSVEKKYYDNTHYIEVVTENQYDNNYQLKLRKYTNSKGETIVTNYYYNYNWLSGGGTAISDMNTHFIIRPIYSDKWKINGSSAKLIALNPSGLAVVSGKIIRPKYLYSLATGTTSPISIAGYTADVANMANGVSIPNFKLVGVVTRFDDKGNNIESSDMADGSENVYASAVIDNQNNLSLAEARNAKYEEIAYSGFEADYTYSSTYIFGNTGFSTSALSSNHHLLGRSSYQCSNASSWGMWTTGNLEIGGKKYIASLWVLDGGSIHINDGTSEIPLALVKSYTVPQSGEVWHLYRATFVPTAAGIGIWGDGFIDEFKLYPSDCLMTTHNYLPFAGPSANVDCNDNITTFEYDVFGNLTVSRDMNGNIISKNLTVIQNH